MRALAPLVLAVLVLVGCRSPHECGSVASDSPESVEPKITYQPGDRGVTFTGTAGIWSASSSSLELTASLQAENLDQRALRITFTKLKVGSSQALPGDAEGKACLVLQTEAPETCLPLAGSIEVGTLSVDCFEHESGVSICAENVDVTIHAAPTGTDVSLPLELHVTKHQHWDDASCFP